MQRRNAEHLQQEPNRMRTRGRQSPRVWLTVGCLLVFLISANVQGQTPPADKNATASTESPTKTEAPKAADIEARIKDLNDSTLEETVKTMVLEQLQLALAEVKRATDLQTKAATFDQSAKDAATRAAAVKQKQEELKNKPLQKVTSSRPLPELEQELTDREATLAALKKQQADLEASPKLRAARRKEIRESLLSVSARVAEISQQMAVPPPTDEPPPLTEARRLALQARKTSAEAELAALQNELSLYDAEDSVDLVRLNRDLVAQQIAVAERELSELTEEVNRRRRVEAQQAIQKAREALVNAHPVLKPIAERNKELAEQLQLIVGRLEAADHDSKSARTSLDDLPSLIKNTKEKVSTVGSTGPIGLLLRKQRGQLPDVHRLRTDIDARAETIEQTQMQIYEFDEERSQLADIDPRVEQLVAKTDVDQPKDDAEEFRTAAVDLLQKQRELLDSLMNQYNLMFDRLLTLDLTQHELIREINAYSNYIDERILWIRSGRILSLEALQTDRPTLELITNPHRWIAAWSLLVSDIRDHLVIYASALLLFGSLYYVGRQFRNELASIGGTTSRTLYFNFAPTARAVFLTAVIALPGPGLLAYVSWRLFSVAGTDVFAVAVATGLLVAAQTFLPAEFFRQICRSRGLAEAHFGWPSTTTRSLRAHIRWFLLLELPLIFLAIVMQVAVPEYGRDAYERIVFIAVLVVASVIVHSVLKPSGGVFRPIIAATRNPWAARLKWLWHWVGTLTPLAIAMTAYFGFYYSAQVLTNHLGWTLLLMVVLLVVRGLLLRLVLIHRRQLSMKQARERKAAQSAAEGEGGIAATTANQPGMDVNSVSAQTGRLVDTGLIFVSLVGMWMIWVQILPALSMLDRVEVWSTTTQETETIPATVDNGVEEEATRVVTRVHQITLKNLLIASGIGIITFVAARNIPGLLAISVLPQLPLDAPVQYAITRLASYSIVLIGVASGAFSIGLGWSQNQWLATALTFGLAFGLKEIFDNFLAGLIILFEQPIRVGDIVTIADVTGVVSRVRIRATSITTWERKEFIVPNKEFITGRLLNWTLSDTINRLIIEVGVAYGSDTEKVRGILFEVARNHPEVLADPAPAVTFEGFGDNSLNFVIRVYLASLEHRLETIHQLHTEVNRACVENGIEIAFPQRDLHIRSLPPQWILKNAPDPTQPPLEGNQAPSNETN